MTDVAEFIDTVERITAGASVVDPSLVQELADPVRSSVAESARKAVTSTRPRIGRPTSNSPKAMATRSRIFARTNDVEAPARHAAYFLAARRRR